MQSAIKKQKRNRSKRKGSWYITNYWMAIQNNYEFNLIFNIFNQLLKKTIIFMIFTTLNGVIYKKC
ncbi:MAG: hypothetical protein EAZ35_10675 [Sphingobacteriia bacterium]|nr:MAG: hypothetical protein EAZ41_03230 [Sphingobacteriia bacterium]TAG29495.1 MAG: hypothetical protein EAZ35_10675 [Sphingobacteriia bacterium]